MTRAEAARLGGLAVVRKYGADHLRDLARKGGAARRDRYGVDDLIRIGAIGGLRSQDRAFRETPYSNQVGWFSPETEDIPF